MNEICVMNIGGMIPTENCVPLTICPPQIPHGVAWDWTFSPWQKAGI